MGGRDAVRAHTEALALVTSDPPIHTRRRRAVQAAFTNRQAELARPRIEALAERLLDEIEANGPTADLISDFTTPLAYTVICEMAGVPISDLGTFRPWVDIIMSFGTHSPEVVNDAHANMYTYFYDLLQEKRRLIEAGTPGDDLTTQLLSASDNERLSGREIVVLALGLVVAGGETTTKLAGDLAVSTVGRPRRTTAPPKSVMSACAKDTDVRTRSAAAAAPVPSRQPFHPRPQPQSAAPHELLRGGVLSQSFRHVGRPHRRRRG